MVPVVTLSGARLDLHQLRPEQIHIHEIARALAFTCRYNGQVRRFYSVAEHSVLVSRHCDPQYAREGLMHDGAEAYMGDLVRPIKVLDELRPFRDLEHAVELALMRKFGLKFPGASDPAVKCIDDRILVDEIRALRNPEQVTSSSFLSGLEPTGAEIVGYSPERAEVLFLARFGELFPEFVNARMLRVEKTELV